MFPTVAPEQLPALSPSLFFGMENAAALDDAFHETMERVYLPLLEDGLLPYNLWRISSGAYHQLSLFTRTLGDLSQMTALEIGSGAGMKSMSWCRSFKNYIGVEIDRDLTETTQRHCKRFGIDNAEFHTANAAEFVRDMTDDIDLLILYAVLEHLTLEEREEILALAGRVAARGGAVYVEECPNRLIRFDNHSFRLPFVQWLPLPLMRKYIADKSNREKLVDMVGEADDPETMLFRAGVGLSFHEFELFWPGFADVAVLSDGFSPEIANFSPVSGEDLALLDYFEAADVPAHALFAKHLLSGIFSKSAGGLSPKVRRLPVLGQNMGGVALPGNTVKPSRVLMQGDARIALPAHEGETVLSLGPFSSGQLSVLGADGCEIARYDLGAMAKARLPLWHDRSAIALPAGGERVLAYRGEAGLHIYDILQREAQPLAL